MSERMDWTDKVVVITGGSRGIGEAVCLSFVRRGARVVTCARGDDALSRIRALQEAPGLVETHALDITDEAATRGLFETISARHGQIDVLVNNAGILGPLEPLAEVEAADWRKTLEVNLTGTFLVCKHAAALLGSGSRVINVSSGVGRQGRGTWGPYSVSKFGVEGLSEVLADEWSERGVVVVSLDPGGTATGMRAAAYPREDPASLPAPDEVAETFVLLAETLEPRLTGMRYRSRDLLRRPGAV